MSEDHDPSNLPLYFAKIITSPFNQHVQVRIVASAGKGKSYSALYLAEEVSKYVAEIKGGKPEDYFNFENDLAVMSVEQVERVLQNPQQYHVLLLDDIATAVGARDFSKTSNKDLSKIIQTFRPKNNLVIETMQQSYLVDKNFRTLAHFEIEIEQNNFPYGYVVAKVQKIDYKHKTQKIYFPYLVFDGKRYIRHIFQSPSKEIREKYDAEREKQLKIILENDNEEEYTKEPVRKPKSNFYEKIILDTYPTCKTLKEIHEKIQDKLGHAPAISTIGNILKSYGVEKNGRKK